MKRILMLIILMIILSISFSETSWTVFCKCKGWFCSPSYQCASLEMDASCSGCGVNAYGTDCSCCQGAAGACYSQLDGCHDRVGKCVCNSGWQNCNGGNGCESLKNGDPDNCGACSVDCGNAPCLDGVCGDPDMWARVRTDCNFGADTYYGVTNTEDWYRVDNEDVNYGDYTCVIAYTYDKSGYGYCSSGYRDCNNEASAELSDGCEVNINTDLRHCGSCAYDCYNYPCSGALFQLFVEENGFADSGTTLQEVVNNNQVLNYMTVSEINQYCSMSCSSGSCLNYTKYAENCDFRDDCTGSYVCTAGPPTFLFGSSLHWCCESDECGHSFDCYDEGEDIQSGGEYFICDYDEETQKMVWKSLPKRLSLSRMLQYNRDNSLTSEEFDDEVYFTKTGVTGACVTSDYSQCVWGEPHYAYQYCSRISAVFDGMFNLELSASVPVRISEQSLYDPYGETELIASFEGCTGPEGLNC